MFISIAPIYKLKHDILYHIFTLNADIFDCKDCRLPHDSPLRALATTRYSSQVCREWRSIILGSSTLWARLLDLDLLQQEEGDWRDEILRRSGETAPLWIRNTRIAMMDKMPLGLETFLLRLLDEYWDRVQKVDIFVKDWADLAARCEQLCLRPAPCLQNFTVEMSTYCSQSITPSSAPVLRLFGNNAPSIMEFCAPRMPLDTRASWLSHLRKLTMFIPQELVSLFDAFTTMPLLEEIDIVTAENCSIDFKNEDAFVYEKQINLPRLEMLAVKDSLRTCLTFVEHINPGPGCSLHLESSYSVFAPLTPHLLPNIQKPVFRYFSGYFECHKPETNFEFRILDAGSTMQVFSLTKSGEFCFFFGVTCEDGYLDSGDVLSQLLSPFKFSTSTFPLANVKGLVLKIQSSPTHGTLSPLFDLLSSFTSVTMIKADNLTLNVCAERRVPSSPLPFPQLQTLVLEAESGMSTKSDLDVMIGVVPFLRERRHVGDKVRTLDLTCLPDVTQNDVDMLIQGELKDLVTKVKWEQDFQVIERQFE